MNALILSNYGWWPSGQNWFHSRKNHSQIGIPFAMIKKVEVVASQILKIMRFNKCCSKTHMALVTNMAQVTFLGRTVLYFLLLLLLINCNKYIIVLFRLLRPLKAIYMVMKGRGKPL